MPHLGGDRHGRAEDVGHSVRGTERGQPKSLVRYRTVHTYTTVRSCDRKYKWSSFFFSFRTTEMHAGCMKHALPTPELFFSSNEPLTPNIFLCVVFFLVLASLRLLSFRFVNKKTRMHVRTYVRSGSASDSTGTGAAYKAWMDASLYFLSALHLFLF